MYSWKKCGIMLALSLAAGVMTISSFAASRKKINSVSIKVESSIMLGDRHGDEEIEIETRGKNYRYDYYEIENFGNEWFEDDVPEITIYLKADEGYFFSLTKASSLKLTGADYVKMSTQDSSETLALRVKLPPAVERLGEETEIWLTENGLVTWDEVQGAGSYELRLYRDGKRVGTSCQSTDQLFYDYADRMKRAGSYQVNIRAVSKYDSSNKGEWMESETVTVSKEMAAARNETAGGLPVKGEWKSEGERLWYRHEDGTYTRNNWEMIDGTWYLFDEDGYVRTGWVEWNGEQYYCKEGTGEMLRNTATPDGYLLDSEGHIKMQ